MKAITRTIWILSLVSLFTDTASEMLYPIMPLYLQHIGFSVLIIGVLEGFAEAIAGLSKGYFGKRSDYSGKRVPFVQAGYALSALSKPMMALLVYPAWVFVARTMDRLGKGVRTGARDAILSDESTAASKGKVFGFHRSMDTIGAVIGPLLALIYLQYYPEDYRTLFVIALAPGLLAISCTLLLKDKKIRTKRPETSVSFFSFLRYWKDSPAAYRKLLIGLLAFTLFNSSDVFLLLRIKNNAMTDESVIMMYVFYNLVYAIAAFPLGIIADKIGLKRMFLLGLIAFALVYFGMANGGNDSVFYYGLFFLYGVYAAATEGVSKAWISNIADKKDTATAIGTYTALQSICSLLASTLAGLLWMWFGAAVTFMATAIATLIIVFYCITLPYSKE